MKFRDLVEFVENIKTIQGIDDRDVVVDIQNEVIPPSHLHLEGQYFKIKEIRIANLENWTDEWRDE